MTKYERITYRTANARRTVRLEVTAEVGKFLVGYEVDAEGDRIQPPAAFMKQHSATDGYVKHVIEASCATRRQPLVVDLHYGYLVPDGTATEQQKDWSWR